MLLLSTRHARGMPSRCSEQLIVPRVSGDEKSGVNETSGVYSSVERHTARTLGGTKVYLQTALKALSQEIGIQESQPEPLKTQYII